MPASSTIAIDTFHLFFSASALQAAIIFCASAEVRQGLVRMSSPCASRDAAKYRVELDGRRSPAPDARHLVAITALKSTLAARGRHAMRALPEMVVSFPTCRGG